MWRLKVLLQFVLAHLPFGERVNFRLQNVRGAYSREALLRSFLVQAEHVRRLNDRHPLAGLTVVEVGPGWKGMGLVVLALFGVERIHAYDHVKHVRYEIMHRLTEAVDANLAAAVEATGLDGEVLRARVAEMRAQTDLDSLLHVLHVDFHAPADASSTGLPDHSVDLVYSYGVLEHVSPATLSAITAESKRVLKSTGRAFHNIGMHDHYEGVAGMDIGVNFLKYPEWLWRALVDNPLAYHNRLRLPDYFATFAQEGAEVAWSETELLEKNLLAVATMKVDERFQGLSHEELATSHLFVDLVWR